MYHIKSDKRAQTSANLIYKGLCSCLKEKPFDQITIQDIQIASSVSRSTFYRHFDCLSDVLYWQCDLKFYDVLSTYEPNANGDVYDFAHYFLSYWAHHSEILELLLQLNRVDIIYSCHMNNTALFQQKYAQLSPIPTEHIDYFLGMRTGIFIGILMTWLKNGKRESIDEMFQIMQIQFEFIRQTGFII